MSEEFASVGCNMRLEMVPVETSALLELNCIHLNLNINK